MSSTLPSAPTALQDFQLDFGRYLRAPRETSRPPGLPAQRAAVYERLLFNNVCGFIDRCFPVSKGLFPASSWRRLCRAFYRDWRCSTPIFAQIPYEFVCYVAQGDITQRLPLYLSELLHYEWVELEVDMAQDDLVIDMEAAAQQRILYANRSVRNLAYQWPVHRIRRDYRPRKPVATYLLVYRDAQMHVQFMETSILSALLVQKIIDRPRARQEILAELAAELQVADVESFSSQGAALLDQLILKTIIFETGAAQ